MLYICVLWVWIICVDGRSRYLYIVLGGYLRILGAPNVPSCCTLSIYASYRVFVCGRYRKSILVCVWLSDLDLSQHRTLFRSSATYPLGLHSRLVQKTVNEPSLLGQEVWTHFAEQFAKTAVIAPPLIGCVVWGLDCIFNMAVPNLVLYLKCKNVIYLFITGK